MDWFDPARERSMETIIMFRFRLRRILDYRRLREEQLEQDLRQLQQQHEREEVRLLALQDDSRVLERQLSASQGTTLLGDDVHRWRHYYQVLDQRIVTQKRVVSDASKAVETSRQKLLEARRGKKILEKLKAKAYRQYMQEHAQREQKLIDELTTMRSRYGRETSV